jgi:hypothetical protein
VLETARTAINGKRHAGLRRSLRRSLPALIIF